MVAFTADLLIRGIGAAAAGKHKEFLKDVMNFIDFLAIFPFYLRLLFDDFVDLRFLRVIRLARILRSLKSARYGSLGAVVVDIVINSVGALFIPVYFMILALVRSAVYNHLSDTASSIFLFIICHSATLVDGFLIYLPTAVGPIHNLLSLFIFFLSAMPAQRRANDDSFSHAMRRRSFFLASCTTSRKLMK
eukprot:SAG31_NODE_276_length_18650_cov_5.821842_15_plen_191_part_00